MDGIEGRQDVAEVCLRGHATTGAINAFPQYRRAYCESCGAKTVTRCPKCDAPIPGSIFGFALGLDVRIDPGLRVVPSYCGSCGQPYPWTEEALRAAEELAQELDDLDDEDRRVLKDNLPDLMVDTARTNVAGVLVKRVLAKAKGPVGTLLMQTVSTVLSETAKKLVFPS